MSLTVFYDNKTEKYWLLDNWTRAGTHEPLGIFSYDKESILHAAHKIRIFGLSQGLMNYLSRTPSWIAKLVS